MLGDPADSTGLVLAARRLPDDDLGRGLAVPMRDMPVYFVGLVLTPFDWGTALNWTHRTLGVTLSVLQAVVAVWLCTELPTPRVPAAASLELVGGLTAAHSVPASSCTYLLQGELLFNLGFCLCQRAPSRSRDRGPRRLRRPRRPAAVLVTR